MARKKQSGEAKTADYRHTNEKRTNIPPAKLAAEGKVPAVPKARYEYNPHLPPVLRFDSKGNTDKLPELISEAGGRALKPDEQRLLADALRHHQPWLEWAGKREQHERGHFDVDPVALHIHERVSAQATVRAAMREDVQRELFADPQLEYQKAVQFYKHDVDWANRLILGDSLEVMSSLARRENLAGKVQMIYVDPPYGIKFSSNFQPEIRKREVGERESDLTREPETVRAYRDAWNLGVHSYLSYLRDRIVVARDLLAATGSIFVQIGDENLHRVRMVLDEVFGVKNHVSVITLEKTSSSTQNFLPSVTDYLLWYARDTGHLTFQQPFLEKRPGATGGTGYTRISKRNGERGGLDTVEHGEGDDIYALGDLTSQSVGREKGEGAACWFPVTVDGKEYLPSSQTRWKTNEQGMTRLIRAERVEGSGARAGYVRLLKDFPVYPVTNFWDDVMSSYMVEKRYVVQTNPKIIERCIHMTTRPGDLILDPTCGSGTTAVVAEQWGRRWLTIDTSRVALSIARQRILTSRYEFYRLRDDTRGVAGGFTCRFVPHVTLGSIAKNPNLDPIFAKHEPILDKALAACNRILKTVGAQVRQRLKAELAAKRKRDITEADQRRWELPGEAGFEHWSVPFDTDPQWPQELQNAVTAYRRAWRAKMDEVNACIEANADQEELVDQPEVVKGVVRVSGPFTVEGVQPAELSLLEEGLFGGAPEDGQADPVLETKNLIAYLTRMVQHLGADGVTFMNNQKKKFARLEPLFESATGSLIHAEGVWEGSDDKGPSTVAVGFGPQYGPVTAQQVEELIRASKRYDEVVIAGFNFDAEASAVIQEATHPKLHVHQAYIRPDINPGMEGLLKDTPNSQLFTVFGQPEIGVSAAEEDGKFVCTLRGVDIYDPLTNTVHPTGAEKVAAWFLDSDYDGRCFCITQAFFPNQDAWEKIAKALGGSADPEAFAAFKGTRSLPFAPGKHRRIAVKVIDPRGNEVMKVCGLNR